MTVGGASSAGEPWPDAVRPPGWRNPTPKPLYDLVVIGGGTAGLVCAAGAAGLGATVALIERHRLGGDCLNTGCVPSKAMLRSAHAAAEAKRGEHLGVRAEAYPEFRAVMERVRARRASIAPHDSAARFAALGVDVFFAAGAFADATTVSVGSARLRFRKAVIATGTRPAVPSIPGLSDVPYLTNETLFDMVDQPGRLAIIGGGPIGCEMGQAFARLGTDVTLYEAGPRLLPRDDAEASAIVAHALRQDGVDVRLNRRVASITSEGECIAVLDDGGRTTCDAILVATGRVANIEGLALDAAGIASHEHGIAVDDRLRTSNRRVFASGDVASSFRFTHAADAFSRLVIQNALFLGRKRASRLVIPWCTFTDPPVAHVGTDARQAAEDGVETITVPLTDVDRAVVDDETDGFVRIHHRGGRIAGATIVGSAAGDLIGTVALAMQQRITLGSLASVAFPYPTMSLALRQAADAYRRTRLTPRLRKLLQYYFRSRVW